MDVFSALIQRNPSQFDVTNRDQATRVQVHCLTVIRVIVVGRQRRDRLRRKTFLIEKFNFQ